MPEPSARLVDDAIAFAPTGVVIDRHGTLVPESVQKRHHYDRKR